MYIVLCLKWKTNKDLLDSIGNSAQCYAAAWMGGEFGEEWIHVFAWLSPSAVHSKLLLSSLSAILQYKIKSSKKKYMTMPSISNRQNSSQSS